MSDFKSLWQLFKGLFGIWQNFEPTLSKITCNWAIFIDVNGRPNMVTLLEKDFCSLWSKRILNFPPLNINSLFREKKIGNKNWSKARGGLPRV